MRGLTIHQPWAWAICHGKDIENRVWKCRVPGPVVIHAGLKFDTDGHQWLKDHSNLLNAPIPEPTEFNIGGIIAISNIVKCVAQHPSPFFFGPYGMILKNTREIKFVKFKGKQRFFHVPNPLISIM